MSTMRRASSVVALIFRGPLHQIQSQSHFATATRNIPELGTSESIPLTEYFPFRVLTPNSQNNTDTLKYQNGLSNVVNDKGRLLQ
jgi:hypothetical protein